MEDRQSWPRVLALSGCTPKYARKPLQLVLTDTPPDHICRHIFHTNGKFVAPIDPVHSFVDPRLEIRSAGFAAGEQRHWRHPVLMYGKNRIFFEQAPASCIVMPPPLPQRPLRFAYRECALARAAQRRIVPKRPEELGQ